MQQTQPPGVRPPVGTTEASHPCALGVVSHDAPAPALVARAGGVDPHPRARARDEQAVTARGAADAQLARDPRGQEEKPERHRWWCRVEGDDDDERRP